MNILIINAGSSSLKYQLFNMPSEQPLSSGLVEKIGAEGSFVSHKVTLQGKEKLIRDGGFVRDHTEALQKVLALLSDPGSGVIGNPDEIEAVGHRVVHGGEYYDAATFITEETKQKIVELSSLAPLHNPVNYRCIEIAESTFPKAKQVAVFDTAFHQTMPAHAFRYAIPESFYYEEKIRAYGFHGTSHHYVTQKAMQWLGKPDAKVISIHLGNGCSITAVNAGRSIDTSMGFGPLSGLVMGTRSGDIDPSVIFHLLEKDHYDAERISKLFNKESGLLGYAGSNDMRDVRRKQQEGSPSAQLILEMYTYRIRKYIGSYMAALNGIDAIVFTAGVGENDPYIRESICSEMDCFNIHLDPQKNRNLTGGISEISTTDAPVKVLVVPTNEEFEIARQTYALLHEEAAGELGG